MKETIQMLIYYYLSILNSYHAFHPWKKKQDVPLQKEKGKLKGKVGKRKSGR